MWGKLLDLGLWLLGIFFPKTDERDKATQTGKELGHGEDAEKSLDAAQQAQDARNRVDIDLGTKPDKLRDNDPFERPD